MAAKTGWSVREFIYFAGFLSICGFLVGITCLASLVAKCKETTSSALDPVRLPGTNRNIIQVRHCPSNSSVPDLHAHFTLANPQV